MSMILQFEPTVLEKQVCYSIDVNKIIASWNASGSNADIEEAMRAGLILMLDLNQERDVVPPEGLQKSGPSETIASLQQATMSFSQSNNARIYLSTVGNQWKIREIDLIGYNLQRQLVC